MGTPHDLYERYAADVYRFALYLSGNPAEAEDIAADTFVRLWTAPGPICGARAADGLALQVHRQDDRLPQRRLAFVAARRVEQPRHHRVLRGHGRRRRCSGCSHWRSWLGCSALGRRLREF